MGIRDTVKGFLKMAGHYKDSAVYLAEHGYNDTYLEMLLSERETAKKKSELAEGQALYAQALMFMGRLKAAANEYENTDIDSLARHLNSVFVNNYILCMFLLNKGSKAHEIYEKYNAVALAENTLVMRRSVGINEYACRRYENAVTVFVKLLSEPDPRTTLMADICLVRAMLALDMTDRAREIAGMSFDRYSGMGDITAEVNKLRLKINSSKPKKSGEKKKKKK